MHRGRPETRSVNNEHHDKTLHMLALSIFSDNGIEAAAALHELLKWSSQKVTEQPTINPQFPPGTILPRKEIFAQPTYLLISSLTKFIYYHITPWIQGPSIDPAITALTILSNLVNSVDSIPIIPNCILVASCPDTIILLLRLCYHPYSPLCHIAQSILEQIGRFCNIREVLGSKSGTQPNKSQPEKQSEPSKESSERSDNDNENSENDNDDNNFENSNDNSFQEINEFVSTLCSLFQLANPAKDEAHIDIFINFALLPENCRLFMDSMGTEVMVNRIAQLLGYPSLTIRDILLEAVYLFCMTNTDFKDAACSSNFLLRSLLNLTIPPSQPFETKTVVPFTPCQKACVLLLDLSDDSRVLSYLANFKVQLAAVMLKWKSNGLPQLALKVSNASSR